MQEGNVAIFLVKEIETTPKLWLYLKPVTTQVGRRPPLIFDLNWSGMNESTISLDPMEEMHFDVALQHILKQVFLEEPCLGQVYIRE